MGKFFNIGKCLFTIMICSSLHAFEFSLKLSPSMVFSADSKDTYAGGNAFGGFLNADFVVHNILTVGPEFSFFNVPREENLDSFMNYGTGICLGLCHAPLSRLFLSASASYGMQFTNYKYSGEKNADGTSNPLGRASETLVLKNSYYKAFADASFRFTPDFTVGLGVGYADYGYDGDSSIFHGPFCSVSVRHSFETRKKADVLGLKYEQQESVFPLFASSYRHTPFASAILTNYNSAEIKDVRIYFKADKYVSSVLESPGVDCIGKKNSAEVFIYADFSESLSSFSENGQFPAEIIVEYKMLGKKYSVKKSVLVSVSRRNSFSWIDETSIASLVSPNDSSVIELAKRVVGMYHERLHSGVSQKLEHAMALFESLNTMNIIYERDAVTPYEKFHLDYDNLDTLQFPYQTISFRSGDADDLAVLYASLLGAVNIDSAFIFLPDDVIVAVNLNMWGEQVLKNFSSFESLVLIDDEYYLPVSMKNLSRGFSSSWKKALAEINAHDNLDYVVVRKAWETYAPLGILEKASFENPDFADLTRRTLDAFSQYKKNELAPVNASLLKKYASSPSHENSNAVALSYLRLGDYASAESWFRKGAEHDYVPSVANLGNVLLLQKKYDEAEKYLKKALLLDPGDSGARQGLERVRNAR